MIIELAALEVGANRADDFVKAFSDVKRVLARAQGFLTTRLLEDVEHSGRFIFEIHWSTLEDHTELFLGSELFAAFEAIVRPYLNKPPDVRHFRVAAG